MEKKDNPKDVLDLLIAHEEAVARLYILFSEIFPSQREFWRVLSLEEKLHASWIRNLYATVSKGKIHFLPQRFDCAVLRKSLNYVDREFLRCKESPFLLDEALRVAIKIETSPIESKFFEVYESDFEELKQLITSLDEAFQDHAARLKDFLKKTG